MHRFRAGGSAGSAFAAACVSLCFFLGACDRHDPTYPSAEENPGPWILDSIATVDFFPYAADACAEVFPPGSASSDTLPAGSVAWIRLTTTACYALTVRVVDADSDTVRTFSTRFSIFNRSEGEKNRGVSSYIAWDGKDDLGELTGPGRYLWHMEFDYGSGNRLRYRADIMVP